MTNLPQTGDTPTAHAAKIPVSIKKAGHLIGATVWSFALTKLLVFDFDRYLVETYWPDGRWLIDYKLVAYFAIAAILILIFGTARFLLLAALVAVYPIILLFWTLPTLILKKQSWNFALASLTAITSFVHSLRYNVITTSLWLASFAIALTSKNGILLYSAIATLLVTVIITYSRSFLSAFQAGTLFKIYTVIFSATREAVAAAPKTEKQYSGLPVTKLDDNQLRKWRDDLGTAVLANRVCLFAAKKLQDYQKSGFGTLFGTLTILALIFATTITFAAINMALFKIDQTQFEITSSTFFSFFYYSFNNLLFNSIKEISPVSTASQSIAMLQNFLALVLIGLFASLLMTVRSERYANEIDRLAKTIEEGGREIEEHVREEYRMQTIDDAISELERLQAGAIQLLVWFTKNLRA